MKLASPRGGRTVAAAVAATLIGLTGAVPAVADPAEGRVANAEAPTAVPGSYLVLLTPGGDADSLATEYDGTVTRRYPSIDCFAVTMSARQARRLAADPAVLSVEADTRLSTNAAQPNPP